MPKKGEYIISYAMEAMGHEAVYPCQSEQQQECEVINTVINIQNKTDVGGEQQKNESY
jgi:hypothetical protein